MREIKLTRGRVALVDDTDFEWLNQWKWTLLQDKYAHRNAGGGKWIRMHRLIIGAPIGFHVDHINGDGLDNRRSNLRLCSASQNLMNRGANKNSRSGYKDIFWQKDRQRWFVQVMKDGRKYNGGRHKTLEEAIIKRNNLLNSLHKEFAHG